MVENKSEGDWVSRCIEEANKEVEVTRSVISRLQLELRGSMSEQSLPASKLTQLADELIAATNFSEEDSSQTCE